MKRYTRVNAKAAKVLILPLLDSPLTKWFGYPYLSIGVVGVKRP